MKITTDGQVTIPLEIRQQLGLAPGAEVEFEVVEDRVYLKKTSDNNPGDRLVRLMQGKATAQLSTDEMMALTRPD